MKSNGFTLIEMLAVIFAMVLIATLVVPNFLEQMTDKKDELGEQTTNIIFTATTLYINDYEDPAKRVKGDCYAIKLDVLVKEGYLSNPVKDLSTGEDVDLTKYAKVSINSALDYNKDTFTVVDVSSVPNTCKKYN